MAPSKRRQPTKEPKPAKKLHCRRCDGSPLLTECAHSRKAQAGAINSLPPLVRTQSSIQHSLSNKVQHSQLNKCRCTLNFNLDKQLLLEFRATPWNSKCSDTPMSHPWLFNPASYGLAGPAPPSATAPPAGTDQSPSTVGGAPLTAQSNAYNVDLSLLDDDIPAPVPATQDITAPVPATQAGLMPSACAVPEPAGAVPLPDGELETSDVTSQPAPSVTTSPTPLVDDHVDSVSQHGQKRPREDSMNSSPAPAPRNGPMHPVRSQSSTGLREWVAVPGTGLRAEAPAALASFHKDVSMTMTSLVRADRKAKVESIVEALRNKARAEAAEAKTAATEQKLALANERLEELERRLESLTVITEENELYPPRTSRRRMTKRSSLKLKNPCSHPPLPQYLFPVTIEMISFILCPSFDI
ncbi:hypothetical protein D9611_012017 [Ephemerocybe angulata]|uniref:Uncharacterized protein n=1 Tax=Ephemerocybe angulata TaxID=980116 RepID=A0A8H5ASZ4_9AGAR|nr:hypothetical protein D9611_012017 [Tulosesus angulatus]